MRHALIVIAFLCFGLLAAHPAQAAILAKGVLTAPFAPNAPGRLSLTVSENLDPTQPIWVSYRMLAMSASSSPSGEVALEGSFEGVPTPIQQMMVEFTPDEMTVGTSGGTIEAQFEANYGKRSPGEMQSLLGAELFQAYQAVNAGNGRTLDGTIVKRLPPLGETAGTLLVSAERASGIQPVGVIITVGQGEIPAELAGGGEASSMPYRIGRVLGIAAFIGLMYWLFIGRTRKH